LKFLKTQVNTRWEYSGASAHAFDNLIAVDVFVKVEKRRETEFRKTWKLETKNRLWKKKKKQMPIKLNLCT
jgi:hypothetical protein